MVLLEHLLCGCLMCEVSYLSNFIALDCDESEGEFYEEVELCYRESKGKLQIDHEGPWQDFLKSKSEYH